MRKCWAFGLVAVLALGGCKVTFHERDEAEANASAEAQPAPAPAIAPPAIASPAPAPGDEALPTTATALGAPPPYAVPADGPAPAITGRFAASPALCRAGAWTFTDKGVTTDGETACELLHREPSGEGQRLTMSCQAEGAETNEQWTVMPADDGGIDVVRRSEELRSSVSLVSCDQPAQGAEQAG